MSTSALPRFLFIEPFYGGSHRDFADGLIAHCRFPVDLVALPARFWKWRMRGAALTFAAKVKKPERYSAVIATSLLSLSDLKALWAERCPPILVYFHENQLSYPLAPGEVPDYQFGFTNITTCLAADKVVFNSCYHRDEFFKQLPGFITMMPDHHPSWIMEAIRNKSTVIYPGCLFSSDMEKTIGAKDMIPPLIIWNHRWEFDKAPEIFFTALERVKEKGVDFRLALLGERFAKVPPVFERALKSFADKIVVSHYLPSKSQYFNWLKRGTVVVSSAIQENFGIAIVEAARFGCFPLLPKRLVYPELIPQSCQNACFYEDESELADKLEDILKNPIRCLDHRKRLAESMRRYAWERMISLYEKTLLELQKADTIGSNRVGTRSCNTHQGTEN